MKMQRGVVWCAAVLGGTYQIPGSCFRLQIVLFLKVGGFLTQNLRDASISATIALLVPRPWDGSSNIALLVFSKTDFG